MNRLVSVTAKLHVEAASRLEAGANMSSVLPETHPMMTSFKDVVRNV